MLGRLRSIVIGRPLPTTAAAQEQLGRSRAIGAFGLDALASVIYGPDEILYVLVLAGAAGTALDLPIGLAITALLAIVVTSYRQTIFAYPQGGGSYTVARVNLGVPLGLTGAAALIIDYLANVAVSVTAGVGALVALAPGLEPHRLTLSLAGILMLVVVNLRGVRDAGAIFVLPTYLFVSSLAVLLGWGLLQLATGTLAAPDPQTAAATQDVSVFLVLRAFAGGCTAMTGVEAIANGVPAFKDPQSRNAAGTLVTLGGILGALFLGVVVLGQAVHANPTDASSTVSQIGRVVAGGGPLFAIVQIASALILVLAANTSFNGFPMLAASMARDGYLPHQFAHRGQRLAYSNGILALGLLAIGLVVAFNASTHALIPLFAVGVFLCFTLSQAGMVRHWLRERGRGRRIKLAINGLGAMTTALVTGVVVTAKFSGGAWVVIILVPGLVALFLAIHRHYARISKQMEAEKTPAAGGIKHTVLVPVADLRIPARRTLAYAQAITHGPGDRVIAVHVAESVEAAAAMRCQWTAIGEKVPLVILDSPYRAIIEPLLGFIDQIDAEDPTDTLTVVMPEFVPDHWWEHALHNQTALRLKAALLNRPGTVVTSVPYHLPRKHQPASRCAIEGEEPLGHGQTW